jgi:hypothetical protein
MKRAFLSLSIAAGISASLSAQTPPDNSARPGQVQTAPQGTPQSPAAATASQTISGVLMDSSCPVISSKQISSVKSSNSSGITTYTGGSSKTAATSTARGETRTSTASASDVSPARSTAEHTATQTPAGAGTAQRSRTTDTAISSSFTTVREKYRDCMVKPTSTSFAIHSDGRLVVFDEASNQLIRQQLASEEFRSAMTDAGGNAKWMSVKVDGSMQGNRMSVTSVKR